MAIDPDVQAALDALELRLTSDGAQNVKTLGAVGDGATDDTPAIQAVIDVNNGQPIFFPAGVYNISSPLNLPGTAGLILQGGGSTLVGSTARTELRWIGGDPTQSLWDMINVQDGAWRDLVCTFETPAASCFNSISDRPNGPGNVPFNNVWDKVIVEGKGKIAQSWHLHAIDLDHNNSEMTWRDCQAIGSNVGWFFDQTQAKVHRLYGCFGAASIYGMDHVVKSKGSFSWYDGFVTGTSKAAFFQERGDVASCLISHAHAEGCWRFLQAYDENGAVQISEPITLLSCLHGMVETSDVAWVECGFQGPLNIIGCQTNGWSKPSFIRLHSAAFMGPGKPFVATIEGNIFLTEHATGLEILDAAGWVNGVKYERNLRRNEAGQNYQMLPKLVDSITTPEFFPDQ